METKKPGGGQHDDREIDVGSIARLGLVLAVVTIGALGIAWVVTGALTDVEKAGHTPPSPIAAAGPTVPIEPRLQPAPPLGLKALRSEEERVLTSYEWVDKEGGVVGIPISQAIDLVAERGLPARAVPYPESSVSMPTQSSLGTPRARTP